MILTYFRYHYFLGEKKLEKMISELKKFPYFEFYYMVSLKFIN